MVRDPGPTWSLTLVLIMLLSTHDLSYFLGTLGNQQQAEKFSWLLLEGIWYNLEQGRMGYTGKGLPEAMLMVICSHKVQMKSIPHLSQLAGTPFCRKHRGSLQVFVLGLHLWKACSFLLNSVKANHGKTPWVWDSDSPKYWLAWWLRGRGEKDPIHTVEMHKSLCSWLILWLWTKHKFLCSSTDLSAKGE